MNHVVEILHFAGCPNTENARRAVDAAVARAALADPVEIRLIEVADEEDARRRHLAQRFEPCDRAGWDGPSQTR
jgi:hypothetical protein